jgi:hypothetical protein
MTTNAEQLEEKENLLDEIKSITAGALTDKKIIERGIDEIKRMASKGYNSTSIHWPKQQVDVLYTFLRKNGFRVHYEFGALYIYWNDQ